MGKSSGSGKNRSNRGRPSQGRSSGSARKRSGVGAQGPSRRAKLAAQRAREARRRRERRIVTGVALGLAFALVVGGIVWLIVRGNTTEVTDDWSITEVQQTPSPQQPIHFGSEGEHKVEMFVDFHCPHCVTFEDRFGKILQEAEAKQQATIDVFPMAYIDQGSANAANGLACAAEAGYPRAYFNALFANATRDWNAQQLIELSSEIGHDPTPEFEKCVNDNSQLEWVKSMQTAAESRGVSATPTIYVDGELVDFETLDEDSLRSRLGL